MFQRFLKRPDQSDSHSDTSSNQDSQKNSCSLPDPPATQSESATDSEPDSDVPARVFPTEPEQPVWDHDLPTQAESPQEKRRRKPAVRALQAAATLRENSALELSHDKLETAVTGKADRKNNLSQS
jgi:hypothetical protein